MRLHEPGLDGRENDAAGVAASRGRATASSERERALPTHRSRRRFSQRTTGLPWNLTLQHRFVFFVPLLGRDETEGRVEKYERGGVQVWSMLLNDRSHDPSRSDFADRTRRGTNCHSWGRVSHKQIASTIDCDPKQIVKLGGGAGSVHETRSTSR